VLCLILSEINGCQKAVIERDAVSRIIREQASELATRLTMHIYF
jgi:hypothetical protein